MPPSFRLGSWAVKKPFCAYNIKPLAKIIGCPYVPGDTARHLSGKGASEFWRTDVLSWGEVSEDEVTKRLKKERGPFTA